MNVAKTNFGSVLYNQADLYRFEERSTYWSFTRRSVFLCFSLVNQRHTSANIENTVRAVHSGNSWLCYVISEFTSLVANVLKVDFFRTVPKTYCKQGGISKIRTFSPGEGLLWHLLYDYLELNFCTHVSCRCMKSDYCCNVKKITINMSSTSAFVKIFFSYMCSYTIVMIHVYYYIAFCIWPVLLKINLFCSILILFLLLLVEDRNLAIDNNMYVGSRSKRAE